MSLAPLLLLPLALSMPNVTLRGVVAEEDVYHGTRLAGASVWLDSGETTTTDADGDWSFTNLDLGTYTVHAIAAGYEEGTCTKELTDEYDEWWCSIALSVAPDDTDPPPEDSDVPQDSDPPGDDSDPPDDDSDPVTPLSDTGGFPPGSLVPLGTGCGCSSGATGAAAGWLMVLGLAGLARRRRC